jgi:hypothetical protein
MHNAEYRSRCGLQLSFQFICDVHLTTFSDKLFCSAVVLPESVQKLSAFSGDVVRRMKYVTAALLGNGTRLDACMLAPCSPRSLYRHTAA